MIVYTEIARMSRYHLECVRLGAALDTVRKFEPCSNGRSVDFHPSDPIL